MPKTPDERLALLEERVRQLEAHAQSEAEALANALAAALGRPDPRGSSLSAEQWADLLAGFFRGRLDTHVASLAQAKEEQLAGEVQQFEEGVRREIEDCRGRIREEVAAAEQVLAAFRGAAARLGALEATEGEIAQRSLPKLEQIAGLLAQPADPAGEPGA